MNRGPDRGAAGHVPDVSVSHTGDHSPLTWSDTLRESYVTGRADSGGLSSAHPTR